MSQTQTPQNMPKKWLFFRGLIREQRHWEEFPKIFEDAFPGVKVYCLDFPGMGTEADRPSPASVEAIARDVLERWKTLLQGTSVPQEWGLLTVSLGGMVGLSLLEQFEKSGQGTWGKFIIMNSSVANWSPFWRRMQLGSVAKFAPIASWHDPVKRERRILEQTTSGLMKVDPWISPWAERSPSLKQLRKIGLTQLLAASKFRFHGSLKTSTLVIAAANDQLAHPKCSEAIARNLGAPLIIHPSAGHDIALEDPHWLTENIREHFLASS